jgi:tripartite-type tricarboxylate transporter receptor subunit TctC
LNDWNELSLGLNSLNDLNVQRNGGFGMKRSRPEIQFATLLAFCSLFLFFDSAFSQTSFFQGKTIVVVQGRDPGGTGDLRVKALFPFLQKYIPGNPTIVSEYMPGGGSRKAANHIFRTSRPDGLTIGNFSSAMVSLAILGESGVLYDIDKFHYLGSPYSTYHAVFVSRKEAGFNSIEKLRAATGIKIGAQSLGFSTYKEGRLFA